MRARIEQLTNQALTQLRNQPAVQQAQRWYQSQSKRDQLIIKGVGWLIAAALVFVIIYAPLLQARNAAESQLERNKALYNLIAQNAGQFSQASAVGDGPILNVVTQQARSSGVDLSRYEQDGQALRVWLDKVAFNDAITWFEQLHANYGINATQVSVDKTAVSGRVDIRATLSR